MADAVPAKVGRKRIPTVYAKKIRLAFDTFDKDGDGSVTEDEISKVLASLGQSESKAALQAKKIVGAVDADKDGSVNYDEFCDQWQRMQYEGVAKLWRHDRQEWEDCYLVFDGSLLAVSKEAPSEELRDEEVADDGGAHPHLYDIFVEGAEVKSDDQSEHMFHVNTGTEYHKFSVSTEQRGEWVSKLLSAQEAGMTLMERMKYLESQDKKTQMKKVGDYWIGDVLNEGGFATVHFGYHDRTGEAVACKIMPQDVALDLKNEIVLQSVLRHPNIVSLRDIVVVKADVCLFMEVASGGDLFASVLDANGLQEDVARYYFRQLMIGVTYCHNHYVIHRDLKLENVMLADAKDPALKAKGRQVLKLIDFGFSKNVAASRVRKWKYYKGEGFEHLNCKAVIGTQKYTAPEMLEGNMYDGMASDIWACGIMLYTMVYCSYPFNVGDNCGIGGPGQGKSDESTALRKEIDAATVSFKKTKGHGGGSEFESLIHCMLERDPEKRIRAEEILSHPWMCLADSTGEKWDKAQVDMIVHDMGRGEVVVPETVPSDPSTWIDTFYKSPMMRLDSVAESQRRKDRGKAGDIDLSVVAAGSRRPANRGGGGCFGCFKKPAGGAASAP